MASTMQLYYDTVRRYAYQYLVANWLKMIFGHV